MWFEFRLFCRPPSKPATLGQDLALLKCPSAPCPPLSRVVPAGIYAGVCVCACSRGHLSSKSRGLLSAELMLILRLQYGNPLRPLCLHFDTHLAERVLSADLSRCAEDGQLRQSGSVRGSAGTSWTAVLKRFFKSALARILLAQRRLSSAQTR